MDKLHIYNTLSRDKEEFQPIKEDFAGIYVCGPTVYGDPHLGHAKSYVSFDIVVRYLRYLDYKVRYVQNITDVGHLTDDADQGEDKLEKQAKIEQLEPMEIAQKYTFNYFRDMDKLGVKRPDISPRATGHIIEQIEMVKKLLENGHAYVTDGNVYFDVSSDEDYGKLSGRDIEEQQSGTRIETASDKRAPEDFALWKKAGEGHIMKWPSPWGEGYPGWHVECSAMSTKYLGEHFDIHGGGMDNQFPHHECEIAQSEGAFNKPFANYWMHNNMVTLEGQKMGKSLGNAISLHQFFSGKHELLSRPWDPQIIRFFLLQSHYRSTTDFSEEALSGAENGLRSLQDMLKTIDAVKVEEAGDTRYDLPVLRNTLESKLNDDFNTAQAIAVLFDELKKLRKNINDGQIPANITDIQEFLHNFVQGVLGLWPKEKEVVSEEADKTEQLIELLIDLRNRARKNKNFEVADTIRDRLEEMDIKLMDSPEGTDYKIKV